MSRRYTVWVHHRPTNKMRYKDVVEAANHQIAQNKAKRECNLPQGGHDSDEELVVIHEGAIHRDELPTRPRL